MAAFGRPAFAAVIVGRSAETDEAVALAGGRVGERLGWGAAPSATAAVLVIEAEGVGEATLADALPRLAAIAEARDMAVVATIAVEQIDAVAGALLASRAVLLCAPTLAERVAALAVSAGAAGMPAGVREGEAERLRRLNAEVARIAALLAGLVEEPTAASVDDRRRGYAAEPGGEVAIDAAAVRAAIRARRMRAQFFDGGLIENPGWDMLLDLFAADLEGAHVSVSSLCIAAAVPPTTALRWIGRMTDAGLFERRADLGDRRRAFIALSADGSAAMRGYVAALTRAGLVLG